MKRLTIAVLFGALPFLTAAIWMDRQPSHRAYQAPVLAPPVDAVPITGKEAVSREGEVKNPVPAAKDSVVRGQLLFTINCAMCHGATSAQRGPVGLKLTPPPPGLEPAMVKALPDADIFKAITFGFGRMPPFQDKLKSVERWDLVNYLRTRV